MKQKVIEENYTGLHVTSVIDGIISICYRKRRKAVPIVDTNHNRRRNKSWFFVLVEQGFDVCRLQSKESLQGLDEVSRNQSVLQCNYLSYSLGRVYLFVSL